MSRIVGTETEYGIATPTDAYASPIVTSTHMVVGYAQDTTAGVGTRWDYESESPLSDARGFDLRRYRTTPVVAADALGMSNMMLGNGARFYVDHAHPEYSSPEAADARTATLYDAAGDLIAHEAAQLTNARTKRGESVLEGHPPCPPLKIYKNNVDGKGASYGAHENYQYARTLPFDVLAQGLIPFFVTRIILIGAGRVGLGERSQEAGFQISQRADYIEQEISLETTLNRGIINTRDEPHAHEDFARLHVIVGDATCSHYSTFLKLGMTSLVIDAIESGVSFDHLKLARPVEAIKTISRDLSLRTAVPLADGTSATAIDIQRAYLEAVTPVTDVDHEVVQLWGEVLDLLEKDPLSTAHLLDWTAKLALLNGYHSRGLAWDDPKMALVDLQYSDVDPAKSLYHALVRAGRMRTMFSDADIKQAAATPPAETRAYARGLLVGRFRDKVISTNWDSVVLADDGGDWVRVDLGNGQDDDAQALSNCLEQATTAAEFLAAARSSCPHLLSVVSSTQ